IPVSRVDARLVRARSTVALATEDRRYARSADSEIAALARESRTDARAHALVLQAGLRAIHADRTQAIAFAERAVAAYRAAGMELHALCAERRGAQLIDACATVRSIDRRMREVGITEPERWTEIYAPG